MCIKWTKKRRKQRNELIFLLLKSMWMIILFVVGCSFYRQRTRLADAAAAADIVSSWIYEHDRDKWERTKPSKMNSIPKIRWSEFSESAPKRSEWFLSFASHRSLCDSCQSISDERFPSHRLRRMWPNRTKGPSGGQVKWFAHSRRCATKCRLEWWVESSDCPCNCFRFNCLLCTK